MRSVLLIALLSLPAVGFADDGEMAMRMEVPRGFLNLTNASVLASPGYPSALRSDLPGSPKPITWPLPDGPVLVLGLPAQDDTAHDVMAAFGLLDDADDLAGGYDVWAWEENGRPIVVLLAADAAALFAARFEFEQSAPAEMVNPSMRMVDVKGSDGASGVLVREGHRRHRPTHAVRGWASTEPLTMADAFACAGAHINQLWLGRGLLMHAKSQRALRRMRDFGVEPVLLWSGSSIPDADMVARAKTLGIRRLALGKDLDAQQFEAISKPFDVDEILRFDPEPKAPKSYLHTIQTTEGRFHWDRLNHLRWGEPCYVPQLSTPSGRGAVLEGDRHELEALAAMWDASHPVPDLVAELAKGFPVASGEPKAYLRKTASALRATVPPRPWFAPIASHLEWAADGRPILVPVVPAASQIDGEGLDEPAWAFAAHRETELFDVLALSDGRSLYVAVRAHKNFAVNLTVSAVDRPRSAHAPVVMKSAAKRVHMFRCSAYSLGGTAHIGRVIRLTVSLTSHPLDLVIVP